MTGDGIGAVTCSRGDRWAMSVARDRPRSPIPFFPGGPDALFHVDEVGGDTAAATGSMATGPWTVGPDRHPAPGSLGVLIDVVWGGAAVAAGPSGLWGVSTDMHASFARPLPADGSRVVAHGQLMFADDVNALATGTVLAADGSLLATGTQRTRFAPAAPRRRPLPRERQRSATSLDAATAIGLGSEDGSEHALAITSELANPAGILHGGVAFCASELAASRAVDAGDAGLVPTSMQISYLRPGIVGTTLSVQTEIVHRGRTSAAVIVRCVRADGRPSTVAAVDYGPVAGSKS